MSVLKSTIANIPFNNPFIAASGCFGFGLEYKRFFEPSELGGVALKTVTVEPRNGNKLPRITETASGMLNAIGLENPGIQKFKQVNMKTINLVVKSTNIIGNIAGNSVEEYVQLTQEMSQLEGIAMIELNVSCPNVENGQLFATNIKILENLLKEVKKVTTKPLILKLAPNVPDIKEFIQMSESQGVDAFTLINTVPAMAIDIHSKKPVLGNIFGGLSGPAIKNIALKCVYEARTVTKLPIIGLGGISTLNDSLEFLMAGASALSIGTAFFMDPFVSIKIKKELENYCLKEGYKNYQEIIGIAHAQH